MIFVSFRIIKAGKSNLFSNPKLNYKYGSLYSDYRIALYAFFIPTIIYQIIRAAAIGLLAKSTFLYCPCRLAV